MLSARDSTLAVHEVLDAGGGHVRRDVDPFSVRSEAPPGIRPSERSWQIARSVSMRMGERARVIDRYLSALSHAPANHLQVLRRRDAAIVFAPTIPEAIASEWAVQRRRRRLSPRELFKLRTEYSQRSGTAGVYDPEIDALVFPTTYVAEDAERVALHELGHALTSQKAIVRDSLLTKLPAEIAAHVTGLPCAGLTPHETLRAKVLEALADGYVFLVVGRHEELPQDLMSELLFILHAVTENAAEVRYDFGDEDG
jgi:hypothetical protein